MHEPPFQILEDDLKKLFKQPKHGPGFWDITWSLVKGTAGFLFLYGFFFLLINIPAYSIKTNYYWKTIVLGEQVDSKDSRQLKLLQPAQTKSIPVDTEPLAPNGQKLSDFLRGHVGNNHLLIPGISVKAPIVWNSPEDRILEDLHNGVAHYQGTALPGENGNVFIVGHSSNYWWDKGQYNQVFALLDKVKEGDRLYVNYNNTPYVYQVESIKTVQPSDIEVLNPTDHSVLTLMTCTPVGTTLNRLIVQAKQIYPKSTVGTNQKPVNTTQLPAIR